jgi:hypothetical protein
MRIMMIVETYLLYHSQAGIQIKQCMDHQQGGDIGILTTNAVSNGDYLNAGLWARSLLIEVDPRCVTST